MTDGSVIDDEFILRQPDDVMFLKTEDGEMNPVSLKNTMIVIKRYYNFINQKKTVLVVFTA